MVKNTKVFYFTLLLLIVPSISFSQSRPATAPADLVSSFYNNFYPHYLKYLKNEKANLGKFEDLFKPTAYVSKDLYQLLLKDEKKRLSSKGTLDGIIDFDPFTNAQDDLGKIQIGATRDSWGKKIVDVLFPAFPKHKVIVELVPTKTGWEISNFIYPDTNTNLSDILQKLQMKKKGKKQ